MKPRYIRGMTLIETIIALAMLGVLVTGFLAAFGNGFQWVHQSGFGLGSDYESVQQLEEGLTSPGTGTSTLEITYGGTDYTSQGTWLEGSGFNVFRPNPVE